MQLGEQIHTLRLPLEQDAERGWKPHPLFRGTTAALSDLGCHASVLDPGRSPHPPHRHVEEEILMVLDGETDLVLEDAEAPDGVSRQRVGPGGFAYYPAWFGHTIDNTSDRPVTYAMLKWAGTSRQADEPLGPHLVSFLETPAEMARTASPGFVPQPLLDGASRYLHHLHSHLTTLGPDAGYEAHVDPYDVAIVVLEGTVETLGRRAARHSVIFHPAGTSHGIRNAGPTGAVYVVFEFHRASPGH